MLLDRKTFLVKEQIQFMRLSGTYNIFDPESQQQIGVAKEVPSGFIKFLRLLISKLMLPTKVAVYDQEEQRPIFTMEKPFSWFRSKVGIYDQNGSYLGYFRSKLWTLGGGFFVFDASERQIAEIKGDWKGWNFKFLDTNGTELGVVTKKWAGIGKELFTSADNYIISINDTVEQRPELSALLLAAGLAIDIVFKEKK